MENNFAQKLEDQIIEGIKVYTLASLNLGLSGEEEYLAKKSMEEGSEGGDRGSVIL